MKTLSWWAKIYLLVIILPGAGWIAWRFGHLPARDGGMLIALGALASLSLVFKVEGATSRLHYNLSFLVYAFAWVLLGPQAAAAVIVISILVEWLWRKYPWYIQLFNACSHVLALEASGLVLRLFIPGGDLFSLPGIGGILAAMGIFTLLNHLMIGLVVWLARGENFKKSGVFDPLPLMIDFTMLSMGAGAALFWLVSPYAVVLALVPLYLIYSTLKVPALERQTETDPKTGLFNAHYFEGALKAELSRAERYDRPLTVVMADLDLLRNINNTYGHLAGDQVLIGVAKILKESARDYDVAARFGGEEFAYLIPEARPEEVYPRIESIREAIERAEFSVSTCAIPIKATMSFGIAGRQEPGQTPNEIVHNADVALYRAKLAGRNRTAVYGEGAAGELHSPETPGAGGIPSSSLETRLQGGSLPYTPSPLRAAPAPGAEGGAPAKPAEQKPAPEPLRKARPKWATSAYIGGLAVLAAGLFLLTFRPDWNIDWLGLAAFTGMVILTEWLSIEIYLRDTSVSTSAAPLLAGVLLFGPLGAAVLSMSFALVALIKHRSRASRLVFNASNQLIAGLAYTGPFLLFNIHFKERHALEQLALSLFASGVVYLLTTGLVTLAIALDTGLLARAVWKEKFSWLALYYLAMGLIAYALVASYQASGLLGIGFILVPLLLLRFSQVQFVERTKATVNELREKNTILENKSQEISKLNNALFQTLAEVIDLRDPYVMGHSSQVSHYAELIAKKLGLPPENVEHIRKASLMHDLGKLGIPDRILRKSGRLDPDEYERIKQHPAYGADLLGTTLALEEMIPIVRHHHERYDGRGYPDRLKGEEIPLEARIVSLADSVEAMASDRPYRCALSYSEILSEIHHNAGTQFDPAIAKAFLEILEAAGDLLLVNTGRRNTGQLTLPRERGKPGNGRVI